MRNLILLFLSLPLIATGQSAAEKLLFDAEVSRGVLASNGLIWTVNAASPDTPSATLKVKAKGPAAIAELLAPAESAGKRYLLSSGEMYFYRPGTRAPVKVPKRNRISGDAAIGDIASTSFLSEYNIAGTEPGDYQGEAATVFTLDAKPGARPSYSRIRLWVSNDKRVARKAEFYAANGKMLRVAEFQHNASVTVGGKRVPFLSQLKVTELTGRPQATTLNFSDYEIRNLPDSDFTLEALQRGL